MLTDSDAGRPICIQQESRSTQVGGRVDDFGDDGIGSQSWRQPATETSILGQP